MLFANKIMIDNGRGIITISKEKQITFFTKLMVFYEINNMKDIKKWLYENCIDGIDLNKDDTIDGKK